MQTISGRVVRTRYRHPDGAFSVNMVHLVDPKGIQTGEAIVVGPVPVCDPQEVMEFTGDWETSKFGEQFKAISALRILPSTLAGLEQYLSKEVDGIGPSRALRLAKHFGNQLLYVLDNEPYRLSECNGISKGLADRITRSWSTDRARRQIGIFLAHHGITPTWASRILDKFGDQTISVLEANPYRLTEVEGIGFKTADRMAQALDFPEKSPHRTQAAFTHILQEATEDGNVFLHKGKVIEDVMELAGVEEADVLAALQVVLEAGKILEDVVKGKHGELVLLYLPRLHQAETRAAKRVGELMSFPIQPDYRLQEVLDDVESEKHQKLSQKQREAIIHALSNKVSVITGGPGTGKTTTTLSLVRTAERLGMEVLLAAPTGRAAKRLSEVTMREATTIHRLLKFNPTTYTFDHDRNNPIDADLLIVDESSMIDIELADDLLDAVPDTCSVVFIGDANQLPSVGPGMVLRDFIASDVVPTSLLTAIFRQAEESLIVRNAHRIHAGEMPVFPEKGVQANSYLIEVPYMTDEETGKKAENISWLKQTLSTLVKQHIPGRLGFNAVRDVQVLVPMKKGTAGVQEINLVLQEALNPTGEKIIIAGREFRIGDRLIQWKNNYELEVFNGDIGFLKSYDPEDKVLIIDFDGREVSYPCENAKHLYLAYALTIHKSQGSEYPVVITVMMKQHFRMLERNLLYTASTRAQKMALFLANKEALHMAVSKQSVNDRNTFLAQRLRASVKQPIAAVV